MLSLKSKSAAEKAVKDTAAREMKTAISPEQRYKMIAEAAYFQAEKRGFVGGNMAQDWLEAEAKIDRILQQPPESGTITKHAFQQRLEAQLKEWDAKFETLQTKAKKATTGMRSDFEKQIGALTKKRAAAQAKIVELRKHTEGTWGDLKTGAEKTWEEMHQALDHFVSRFK
ncbi:MAG: DUF2934 domain-containing protein [Desulfocapsaceae bacterium]|nr:DUF2934 domain-containing protein [Desulfocapsaceae bacterium]